MKSIKAFVAHSFEERDEIVVRAFLDYFDSLKETAGLTWDHAERAESQFISQKVKDKMEGKNLFIGIFTAKDYRIEQNKLKTSLPIFDYGKKDSFLLGSSDWIIQESGYALAMGMKLLFLIENGVHVNSGLQGDLEFVNFSRDNPSACSKKINQIIGDIIVESVDTMSMQTSASPAEIKKDEIDEVPNSNETALTEEQLLLRKVIDAYVNLDSLISEKKDIMEAEKKLGEIILEFKDHKKYSSSFWKGRFYQLKLDAGFPEAFNELEILCKENPDDISPLNFLAISYKSYGQYSKAVDQYLKISEKQDTIKDRVAYIGKASECFASANNFGAAYGLLLTEFKNTDLDTNILYILYKKLAEIAKLQDNKNLFVAFAEKALDIFPTDYELRFSLAYSYEEFGNTASSLAHYKFLCEHNPDGNNFNNIGVAYSRLGIKGKAIESYKIASEKYDESLAMANMSYGYIEQGFFNEARDILKTARTQENHHKNVDSAITRINEVEEEEEESLTKTLKKVEPEKKFLVKFAEDYALPAVVNITGKWTSRHGEILLNMKDDKVYGETEITYQSLENALATVKTGGLSISQRDSKKIISIDGIIINCSIEYQLKIKTISGSTFLAGLMGGTEAVYKGLMHVSKDEQKIFVMEWMEGKREIEFYEMTKISRNTIS